MAKSKEKIMEIVFLLAACVSILAVALICVFLFANGIPAMKKIGFADFLLGTTWKPGNDIYGIFPMILGSIYVTAGAIIIGVPIGLLTAVFLAYFKGEKYSFKRYALLGCVIGIPLIYVFGVVQLKLITGMGWDKAIMTGALPFIPLDIVKCLAAAVIAYPINRIFANNR